MNDDLKKQIIIQLSDYLKTGEDNDFSKWLKSPYDERNWVFPMKVIPYVEVVIKREIKSIEEMMYRAVNLNDVFKSINELINGYMYFLYMQDKKIKKLIRKNDKRQTKQDHTSTVER